METALLLARPMISLPDGEAFSIGWRFLAARCGFRAANGAAMAVTLSPAGVHASECLQP
jgi:hypothetical protein